MSCVHDCRPRPSVGRSQVGTTTTLVGGTRGPFYLIKRNILLKNTRRRLGTFLLGGSVPTNSAILNLSTLPSSFPLGGNVLNVRNGINPGEGAGRYSILVTVNVHFSSHIANSLGACTGRTGIVRLSVSGSRVKGGMPISIGILKGTGRAVPVVATLLRRQGHPR